MNNTTITQINHGSIPYLCSKQVSKHTFCTAKADVRITSGHKVIAVLCNEHAEIKLKGSI